MAETRYIEPRQTIKQLLPELTQAETQARFAFWWVQKDQDGKFKDVKINHLTMCELLYASNFRRYDIEDDAIFIRIINGRIVKKVTIRDIQDFIFDFLDELPAEINQQYENIDVIQKIRSKVLHGVASFFNPQKLYILKPKEPIKFNKDSISEKYMYFENGFLKITSLKIEFLPYSMLTGYIWENEIIKRTYVKPRDNKDRNFVQRFFWLVSGQKENRYKDLQIAAGYYAHDFYEYKLKALILTDSTVSQGGEANGRTGKTLFCRLVGGMLSHNSEDPAIKTYVEINAKDFDSKDKFKYSDCALDTKLIVLNDLKRNFDVDAVYNDVTEGINVNRKGLHPFKIKAKMILTTNKTVKLSGDSDTDRFLEYEFSNYFSKAKSPEQEFKHWFFRDWNDEDFCRYYTYMAECVQMYFKNGRKLNEPEQINLNKRKLIEQTSEDFIEWIETAELIPGEWYPKTELYNRFIAYCPDYNTPQFKQKRFAEWLKNYCNFNARFKKYNKDENEKRDNTTRYFRLIE